MPELPEVETVRRGLAPSLVGARILRVELRRPDLRIPFPQGFRQKPAAAAASSASPGAPNISVASLDDGARLIPHLGMSGSFRIEAGTRRGDSWRFALPRSKNPRMIMSFFILNSARVIYNDPRRFGFMALTSTGDAGVASVFCRSGRRASVQCFRRAGFGRRLFAGKTDAAEIGIARPAQLIAGLGNIYVCEALAPRRPFAHARPATGQTHGGQIGGKARPRHSLDVLAEAIEAGGSSLRDHRQADGSLGYFQHYFRVYGRTGQTCSTPSCGGTFSRQAQNGRSTFYCPKCQN